MTVVLAQAVLANTSGLPADEFVNSFVFTDASLAAAIATANTAVQDFYNGTTGGNPSIASRLSAIVSRAPGATHVKVYDITTTLAGTPHGSPVSDITFTLAASSNADGLPEEVALCLSYHGAFGTLLEKGPSDAAIPTSEAARDAGAPAVHTGFDKPKSRVRGRIFVGPFNSSVLQGTSPFRPATTTGIAPIVGAGTRLLALTGANWSVWSRRNASAVTTTAAYVDNAWDTQRRRGLKQSARTNS